MSLQTFFLSILRQVHVHVHCTSHLGWSTDYFWLSNEYKSFSILFQVWPRPWWMLLGLNNSVVAWKIAVTITVKFYSSLTYLLESKRSCHSDIDSMKILLILKSYILKMWITIFSKFWVVCYAIQKWYYMWVWPNITQRQSQNINLLLLWCPDFLGTLLVPVTDRKSLISESYL